MVSLCATLIVRVAAGPLVDRSYDSRDVTYPVHLHYFQGMVRARSWLGCLFLARSLQRWLELHTLPMDSTLSAFSSVS